jgi:hypothetical protein
VRTAITRNTNVDDYYNIETHISRRLNCFLRDSQILHQNQYGFVPKSNTLSACAKLIENVKKSIDEHFLVSCLFVDYSKGFNMVDHGMFAHEIEPLNVSGAESDFLLSFLNDRTQFVWVGDTASMTSRIDIGLPQGSPASPTMFNILINRIF